MIKGKHKRNYDVDFTPLVPKFPKISLTKEEIEEIAKFCEELKEAKMDERHYQIDDDKMIERFITGFTGEFVLSKFLGVDAINLTVGKSKDYDTDDLGSVGLKCGIKTTEVGKYHVVHKNPVRPEVLILRDGIEFYICGLATVQVLKDYQDPALILNDKLRARGTKVGFYGYNHLLKFNNLKELKELL